MRPIATKSLKMIQYFKDHPDADVKKVAAKFKTALPVAYKTRKRAREELFNIMPEELANDPTPGPTPEHEAAAKAITAIRDASRTPQEREARLAKYFPGNVDEVLDQRAVDYGAFKDGAALMQGMKRLLAEHAQKHGKTFADDQWEALEMIVHKIGRIVNGNPDKVDHWTDIAGYAKLVADRLEGRVR